MHVSHMMKTLRKSTHSRRCLASLDGSDQMWVGLICDETGANSCGNKQDFERIDNAQNLVSTCDRFDHLSNTNLFCPWDTNFPTNPPANPAAMCVKMTALKVPSDANLYGAWENENCCDPLRFICELQTTQIATGPDCNVSSLVHVYA